MNYSFFGTCYRDYEQFFDCLQTILNQTIIPKEIILINSGDKNIKKEIITRIDSKKIDLIYIYRKLSRVKALNLAIEKSTSKYSFRFDTRSRFSNDYAEKSLKILENRNYNASVVGGVPSVISESNEFIPRISAEIMNRSYIFFFPKHRNKNYSGYSSSVYLGCFKTFILKETKFREAKELISEDSLIINDLLGKGFKTYISSTIKVGYICRESFLNILKLFHSYGYCRANTILITRKLFISKRHLLVFLTIGAISVLLFKLSLKGLFFLPLLLIIANFFFEVSLHRKEKIFYVPIYGSLCQFSWIIGFLWCLFTIFKNNSSKSNFIS